MDLSALRALTLTLNLSAHGVPAVVTRPVPDDTAITTTAIWVPTAPIDESQPFGSGFRRREPRRVLALKRSEFAEVPSGTTIVAPEQLGGATRTWVVDGLDRVEADHWRVIVKIASA